MPPGAPLNGLVKKRFRLYFSIRAVGPRDHNMQSIHKPVVAGRFYPAEAAELRALLNALMAEARKRMESNSAGDGAHGERTIRAVIAPHAGYVYSGPIAAMAYELVAREWERAPGRKRVVLLGPSHRVGFTGLALPGTAGYETPLGVVQLDQALIARLRASSPGRAPAIVDLPGAHAAEHSLEVHVPFLQYILEDFTLVPLVVGRVTPRELANVLAPLLEAPDVLIVVSSDLSHFLDYQAARKKDAETSRAILNMEPERIGPQEACGCRGVNGLLLAAREHGLRPRLVDLRNSGDTAGDKQRVVGYGAYVVG